MSDEAAPKRGSRKATADKTAEKAEPKKRGRKEIKSGEEDDGGDTSPAKRGRGRPKGTKKRSPVKPKAKSGGGRRGRPKKDAKKDSADEDNEENDAGDDEDD